MKKLTAILVLILSIVGTAYAQQTILNLPAVSTDNKATIIFFREQHFEGSALKPSIYVDGKDAERLSNGRWFSVNLEPGKHELQSSAKHEPATVVEITPGQTIYVEMVVVTGNWRGGGRLIQVDPRAAQDKIAKLKPLNEKASR